MKIWWVISYNLQCKIKFTMNKLYPIYTLDNECHDCYKCIRECHVKAIKIKDGHASILNEKCIVCGHCVKVCPASAKHIRYDVEKIKQLFVAKKQVFVSLAPSWSGIFDFSSQEMIALLKRLGFMAVSETALGAQEVSIQTVNIINKASKGLFISSACPVIVDYIRRYNVKFINNITPIASPALTHAAMLKKIYGNNIAVVFIGPCVGKKNEAAKHPELIDAALTFDELNYWIQEEGVNLLDLVVDGDNTFVPQVAYEGGLYPIEGGMNETIRRTNIAKEVQLINVSSLVDFEKAVDNFDPKTVNNKIFIEALACSGGCINGPCAETKKSGLTIISNLLKQIRKRQVIPRQPETVVMEKYYADPVENLEYTVEDIATAMEKIGKHAKEDELNCGGCGYRTCHDLAKALLAETAESAMCVSYMRKIATKKASAILRYMPDAVVIVDENLSIIESNNAFMKMFCDDIYDILLSRKNGLAGVFLDKIIEFSDVFKAALRSGMDVRKEHYPVNNKFYDIIIFTVEPSKTIGAIITDVTQPAMSREKIARKAQEVIDKNITIVRNIACLLGEHVAETELILSSITARFKNPNDN